VGGPGVEDVDWPPGLRNYKTADTTHYVVATATAARACATCSRPFARGDRRSLTVEVVVPCASAGQSGSLVPQFAAEVHHRSCRPPGLKVVTSPGDVSATDPVTGEPDMHYVLLDGTGARHAAPAHADVPPTLVFTTTDPVVLRDLELAEGRSAWVSTYLELGFELFGVDDFGWIRAHAPLTTAVKGSLDGPLYSMTGTVDGREVPLLQWTRNAGHPAYRQWSRAVAATGRLFVLYGEYVHVDTESGTVDLAPGGRLGDIVAALVRVDVVAGTGLHGP
jgi:hypothetical protein